MTPEDWDRLISETPDPEKYERALDLFEDLVRRGKIT